MLEKAGGEWYCVALIHQSGSKCANELLWSCMKLINRRLYRMLFQCCVTYPFSDEISREFHEMILVCSACIFFPRIT